MTGRGVGETPVVPARRVPVCPAFPVTAFAFGIGRRPPGLMSPSGNGKSSREKKRALYKGLMKSSTQLPKFTLQGGLASRGFRENLKGNTIPQLKRLLMNWDGCYSVDSQLIISTRCSITCRQHVAEHVPDVLK